MKLMSWNVNGYRAVCKKGFLDWFEKVDADVVCLQETKVREEQVEESFKNPQGFHSYWHSAEKPGYSGVAVLSKSEPQSVRFGIGNPEIDSEGRVLVAEFSQFVLINAYFPNSQREHTRLGYKLMFCDEMLKFCDEFRERGKNIVLCGDYNIAHQEIDIKNPKSNQNSAGFLPEERQWMSEFLSAGYVDVFRRDIKEPDHYTWWSYRPGVREKNIGWRIDYHCVNKEFSEKVRFAFHQPEIKGSDHCPIGLELR